MTFLNQKHWGTLTSLDLRRCNPELIRSSGAIEEYVTELCTLLKVRRFGACTIVHFGGKEEVAGYSLIQLIETSLVSGHFVNKTNTAYIDIFSCGEYNPDNAMDFSKEFFQAREARKTVLYRD